MAAKDWRGFLPTNRARAKRCLCPSYCLAKAWRQSFAKRSRGLLEPSLEGILTPSARRIAPRCPYFQRCGGCHYQHTDYEYQLEIKSAILKENLRRIAKLELDTELHIHPSPPWNYRNRSRFKIRISPEFAIGYYRFNSHELLPVEECPISSPLINRALACDVAVGTRRQSSGRDSGNRILRQWR